MALSAVVQMMVLPKASGAMFSVNMANGSDVQITIDTIWGLGEYIVLGKVTPDHFMTNKNNL